MTCPNCRATIPVDAVSCQHCGYALPTAPGAQRPAVMRGGGGQKQGLAIASLVLGIASFPLICAFGLGIVTGLVGLVLGIVALVKANSAPMEYGGKGLAIGGIVASCFSFVVVVPMMAAIAIPSLLRARVAANEAGAIGDVRTIVSAEATYKDANGGFYDRLECLSGPASCIPGYPATGPTFLDASLSSASVRMGYRRSFHPGASVRPGDATKRVSPSSVVSFAYVAVPAERNRTGVRAFCGDASGRVCQNRDGSEPVVENGACPATCESF